MKKFATYLFLFLLPLIVIMLPFFIGDPFKILRHYDRYYPEDGIPLYINNNRSYVSTRMYLQYKDSFHYNSFIFGSSRSGNFLVKDWTLYLPDSASCFHFNGYGESLYLVHKKLLFVNGKSPIDNVLLPVDAELLGKDTPFKGHIWVTPIELLDYHQFGEFYGEHIRAYLSPKLFLAYTDLLLTNKVRPYMMEWGIVDTVPTHYLLSSNERAKHIPIIPCPDSYYTERLLNDFASARRDTSDYAPMLKENHKSMLRDIKSVFDQNHTNYKIVINPMWNQRCLAQDDVDYLIELFGKDNVFSFEGKNSITEDYHNYQNATHFWPHIAAKMMQIIYESDSARQQQMIDSIYMRN